MYLAFRFFVWDGNEKMTLLEFRRMFAWEMINNPELMEAEETVRRSKRCRNVATEHSMQTAPKHVRQWTGTKWLHGAKKAYQQYTCSGERCTTKICTYCVCNPNLWLCQYHWQEHYGKVLLEE